jgi:hypothetical protein
MASHRNQCSSTSSSPLPHNYGYWVIKPHVCPTIPGVTFPTKMNPNAPGWYFPGDPNILPLFRVVGFEKLIEFVRIEIA